MRKGRESLSLVQTSTNLWEPGGSVMHAQGFVDLFHARAFGLGLAYGGVAFFAAMIVGSLGRGRRRNLDFAALAFVAAAWLGIRGAWGSLLATQSTAFALIALALGGAAVHLVCRFVPGARDHPLAVAAAAIAPGAAWLAVVDPARRKQYARHPHGAWPRSSPQSRSATSTQ